MRIARNKGLIMRKIICRVCNDFLILDEEDYDFDVRRYLLWCDMHDNHSAEYIYDSSEELDYACYAANPGLFDNNRYPHDIDEHNCDLNSPRYKRYLEGLLKEEAEKAHSKPVDPKQSCAVKKVTFDNVPITLDILATYGADSGAAKYGPLNWIQLEDGTMSLMTYLNAIKRHWILFKAGQDVASDSGIHHLDHLIAGLAVVRDAMMFNKVNDDRIKLSEEHLVILEKLINKEI